MASRRKTNKARSERRPPVSGAAASERRPSGNTTLRLIVLAAVSLGLYADALRNGFVTDDTLQLRENRFVTNFHYIPKLFTTNVWAFLHSGISNYYRPLQMVFYMGEYYLFGFHAWVFHLVNLLLNLAVVFTVYLLIRELGDETLAFWTALFFAAQPVHVEVAVWIASLPELLCALSLFTGMRLYHRARSGDRPVLNHALACTVFFAGMFCKETTLVFPGLLVAYEFFYRRESIKNVFSGWRRLAPYVGALAVYVAIRIRVLGAFAPGFVREVNHPPYTRWQLCLSIPVLIRQYILKLAAPINLNYFYQFTARKGVGWNVLLSAGFVGAVIVSMFLLRKSAPLQAFAIAWFFITLAPVLSIRSVGDNVFTERYLYIPSMGFCVCVAWGWLWIKKRATNGPFLKLAYAAPTILLAFYAAQIIRRIPDWRSDLSLMQKTVGQSPNVVQVQAGLGIAYYQMGQFEPAIGPLERSLELYPKSYLSHLYLALAFSAMGDGREARPHLAQAYEMMPQFEPPWALFGQANVNLKQWKQAIEAYRQAITLEPENPVLYTVLGESLQENGETQESVAAFREAIRLQPGALDASVNLAITLAQQGNVTEAIGLLQAALRAHPSGPHVDAAWLNLAGMYLQIGDLDAAEVACEHALELNPELGVAREMLAAIAERRGRSK